MARKLAVQTVFTALNHMTGPMASMSRGITGFAKNAQRASSGVAAGFRGLRSIIGVATTALAGGMAAKAVSDFAARGDDIADVSKRLGLGAQAWQEFGYAAKLADLTSEDLAGMFQKMNNNMGQLAAGTGALYTYLKRANPQLALQLRHTKNSEKAFTLLMGAIAKEGDTAKRAALAQAAFGRSGQALIDMAGDLNKKRREARESGTIISQEDIDSAQNLHNTLLRLKATGMGVLNTTLAQIAKNLEPVLKGIDAWVKANREFIGQNIGTVFKVIGDVFKSVGPSIAAVINQLLPAIQQLTDKVLPVLVDMLNILLPILGPLLALLGPILDIFVALSPVIKAAAELIKAVLVPVLRLLEPLLNLVAKLLKPIADFIALLVNGLAKILGAPLSALADAVNGTQTYSDTSRQVVPTYTGMGNTPVSPNTGVITSNTTTTRRSVLDVNLKGLPPGTEAKQRGEAPDINVNMGPTMEWGMAGL